MLLTLAVNSISALLNSRSRNNRALLEVPSMAIDQLQLRGLNIYASSLAGWSIEDLDELRDRADKAACPCLVLVDDAPLDFSKGEGKRYMDAVERTKRLATAANRLGCSSLAVSLNGPDNEDAFEHTAAGVREAMTHIERLEMNVLLQPGATGLTNDPDRLTDLIKRIGGFRIGSLPSFGHAAQTGDVIATLRKLAPYAGAMHATVESFSKAGKHKGYDLAECVQAIKAVGFSNTLAIEWVGKGDPAAGIEQARGILQTAIDDPLES
ncbi:MAG: TIM barrel protein [Phycisphaerales bacterium]